MFQSTSTMMDDTNIIPQEITTYKQNQIMKIRMLRQRAGLSVCALAAGTGVYPGEVNNWEHEVYLPTARQLPALATALGCSIDELYLGED